MLGSGGLPAFELVAACCSSGDMASAGLEIDKTWLVMLGSSISPSLILLDDVIWSLRFWVSRAEHTVYLIHGKLDNASHSRSLCSHPPQS